jgi:hypothetical protein
MIGVRKVLISLTLCVRCHLLCCRHTTGDGFVGKSEEGVALWLMHDLRMHCD